MNLIAPWIMDAPMSQAQVAIFRSVGVPIGRIKDVVDVVGHCVTGEKITRESVAVGPHRILDLVDDAEGLDAADAMRSFGKTELPGLQRRWKSSEPGSTACAIDCIRII